MLFSEPKLNTHFAMPTADAVGVLAEEQGMAEAAFIVIAKKSLDRIWYTIWYTVSHTDKNLCIPETGFYDFVNTSKNSKNLCSVCYSCADTRMRRCDTCAATNVLGLSVLVV